MPFGEEYWWGGKKAVPANTGRSLLVPDNATYLQRTQSAAAPTDATKQTVSAWFRQCLPGATISSIYYAGSGNQHGIEVQPANGTLSDWKNNVGVVWSTKVDVFDPSEWNHVVVSWDSAQAVASDRFKVSLNGILLTAWDTVPAVAAGDVTWGNSSVGVRIGNNIANAAYGWRGYLHYIVQVDGQVLPASAFGYYDANGKWMPKEFDKTQVGAHGFILDFADDSNLGKDISGHGDFALTGIDMTSIYLDTPQKVLPLLPLSYDMNSSGGSSSTADPSRLFNTGTVNATYWPYSAVLRSGKWYWEVTPGTVPAGGTTLPMIGVCDDRHFTVGITRCGLIFNGQYYDGSAASAYASGWLAGETVGVELDLDASPKTIRFNVGGAWQALKPLDGSVVGWSPMNNTYNSSPLQLVANFGSKPFVKTMPADCKIVSAANRPTTIDPTLYFGILQWTGTGAVQAVAGLKFQPDMVWVVHRNAAEAPLVFDSTRGVTRYFLTNSAAIEVVDANTLTAFNVNGIGLGTSLLVNKLNDPYIAYCWKKNPAQGFNIVTWGGDGTTPRNIPHGLPRTPALIIVKRRDAGAAWPVGGNDIGAQKAVMFNTTAAAVTNAQMFPSLPDATNLVIGNDATVNAAGGQYMAYVFAQMPGMSWFGSVITTAAQNVGVFPGLRPALMLCKPINAVAWRLVDNRRQGATGQMLQTNLTTPAAEAVDAVAEGTAFGASPFATSVATTMLVFLWAAAQHKNSRAAPPGLP